METDHLVVTDHGRVRWLRLNRPEVRNAMTSAMATALRDQLEATATDDAVGALVICATGPSFSSGVDRKEAFEGPDATLTQKRDRPLWPVEELVTHPKPVVCALNGPAHGGGATLALACDLRVAAQSATLTFNLARGTVPRVRVVVPAVAPGRLRPCPRPDADRAQRRRR